MEVTFYRFSKKVNSTALPSGSGRTFEVTLKAPTSVTAPVIVLHAVAFSYNYCYIPDFKRYYFVSSTRILKNHLIEYTLAVDVLATYRADILAARLYVLRSASDYNLKLPDQTWIHTTDFTETAATYSFPSFDSYGVYLASIVSPNSTSGDSANPASILYVIPPGTFRDFLNTMYDLSSEDSPYQSLTDLEATYFNPFQYITSVRWYPFSLGFFQSISGALEGAQIKYGWYNSNITANFLKIFGHRVTRTIQIGTYTDWTDRDNNWTRHVLYVPSCGLIDIDAAYTGKTVTVDLDIDFNTGQTYCTISDGAGKILAQSSGIIGSEVAINQISTELNIPQSVGGAIAAGISVAGGAIAKNAPAWKETLVNFGKTIGASAALGYAGQNMSQEERLALIDEASGYGSAAISAGKEAAASIADSALQTFLNPTVTRAGADGCRFTIMQNHDFILYTRKYARYNTATESQVGGVCNAMKTLGGLSGYTVVANGVIEVSGLVEERNAITSFLEGGFYIA